MQTLVLLVPVVACAPSLEDNTADLDRLRRAVAGQLNGRQPVVSFSSLPRVAGSFRRAGFKGVAVVNDLGDFFELVDFLPSMPEALPLVALDLGTTHLEATLIDGLSGRVLAREIQVNGQIEFGADILTRIHFATREKNGVALLHRAVIDSINSLVKTLSRSAALEPASIRAVSVSGNTTMVHFLLALDPYHLCREPYIPVVNAPDPCSAQSLKLIIDPSAVVWILPSVGSYFGGDLISGILATDLDRSEKVSMLIDVGTNAEVVIGNRDWLMACAGAAGPALEGGVAQMGMRAGPGVVDHVVIDATSGDVSFTAIGSAPARGICGSGMIDLVAQLYLARAIDIRGKYQAERIEELCPGRLLRREDGLAFIVVPADQAADNTPVFLSQVDLDAMMRSKAAMYAILTTLVAQVGIDFRELGQIAVAGAFGRHIDPVSAITLGMIPDLPLQTYLAVGNSSLAGAEKVLLEKNARLRCREIMKRITYIELNVNQDFMIRFSGSRFIPHTDHALFPSVPFFNDK